MKVRIPCVAAPSPSRTVKPGRTRGFRPDAHGTGAAARLTDGRRTGMRSGQDAFTSLTIVSVPSTFSIRT